MPKIFRATKWIVGLLLLGTNCVLGQEDVLPMDQEIAHAYEAKTRSWNGEPGPAYFQNRSDYSIRATFDPVSRLLVGKETIVYQNNSPDSLTQLVLRLYQDRLRKDFDGDYRLSKNELTDGVDIQEVILNADTLALYADWSPVSRSGTNMFIDLETPMPPQSSIKLTIHWSFTMPNGVANRYGKYGEYSYFVAYWYPQMSVYDDVFGWDLFDHTGQHEFYNDFGDFDVEITVPDSFLLWSTGELLNPEKLYTPTYLKRYQDAMVSDTVVRIVGKEDYESGAEITYRNGQNTWKYRASYVPDFAFAIADYYYWDASSARVSETGRRVLTDACYQPGAEDFYHIAGFAREIVEDLSFGLPGIPYPYPKMTVFNGETGGGGMEFPMIVNDGSSFSLGSAFSLTYHEIAHTYFPFYMGINERRFAWMDEGWAQFFPLDLMKKKGYAKSPMAENVIGMVSFARFGNLKPLMTPSVEMSGMPYYIAAYFHPASAYYLLQDMMGDSLFTLALRTYMSRWHGKHPLPYDFFHTFDEVAGESLSWYWKKWFFEAGKPDLKLDVGKLKKNKAEIAIKRVGNMPVPVHLKISFEDGTEEIIYYTAEIWKEGNEVLTIKRKFPGKITGMVLGASYIPDSNRRDNSYKVKGRKRKRKK
ncbi:MAG: M1 family metallopeptidase [Bacteroidota bacterium]